MDSPPQSKFEAERGRVALLMRRLGQIVDGYEDPNTRRGAVDESGADVVVVSNGRRIGIQVTDLDTGNKPGLARAAESKLARDAAMKGSTYATWGQNDPCKVLDAIVHSVTRKARMSFSGFDEFWLLICNGVPILGATGSTFAMTPWIDAGLLDTATLASLSNSKYTRAFIYAILGAEEQALYEWQPGSRWLKSTLELQPEEQAAELWRTLQDPELWSDPVGWSEREARRILAEQQNKRKG